MSLDKLLETILEWTEDPDSCNTWLDDAGADDAGAVRVYVRKLFRRKLRRVGVVRTLDVVDIQVDPAYRHPDLEAYILMGVHEINPWGATFAENVAPHTARLLSAHGWTRDGATASFFKVSAAGERVEREPSPRIKQGLCWNMYTPASHQ